MGIYPNRKAWGLMTGILVMSMFLCSASEERPIELQGGWVQLSPEVPELEFSIAEVFYDRSRSRWLFQSDSTAVSGYVLENHSDGRLVRKFGLVDGMKEGMQLTYFPNGYLKFEESFSGNKLNGEVRRWTMAEGHQLIAQLVYRDGKLHGEQKKWYATGELHKQMRLTMGKEEGLQQAFRKNGALYANYEARNGRVFGLKRSNLCYELDNEQVVYVQ